MFLNQNFSSVRWQTKNFLFVKICKYICACVYIYLYMHFFTEEIEHEKQFKKKKGFQRKYFWLSTESYDMQGTEMIPQV